MPVTLFLHLVLFVIRPRSTVPAPGGYLPVLKFDVDVVLLGSSELCSAESCQGELCEAAPSPWRCISVRTPVLICVVQQCNCCDCFTLFH